ncbi:MAG: TRAP transporter small permease [Deltaproteobacteria bacterium]|nr:MAG: TRAP transporter small permease [Deltaproteobacteria bacterium]
MKSGYAHALRRIIHRCSRVVYIIGGAGGMVALMFLIVADVCLRYLFNSPIASSNELVMFLMAVVVFSALSYTETADGHVIIDLVVSRLPRTAQNALRGVMSILSLGLFALIAQQNIVRAKALQAEGLTSSILHVPVYPFYLFAAFGCALLCVVLLIHVLVSLIPKGEE